MTATLSSLESFETQASTAFVPLRMDSPAGAEFWGHVQATHVGELILTRITGSPITVRRKRELIHSDDPDLIKVAWHRSGRAGVDQDDRQCVLEPGDMVAYDTTRPYELSFWEPYDIIVIGLPRALLEYHADFLRTRTARPVATDQVFQRLIGAFFGELASVLDEGSVLGDIAAGPRNHLADALIAMIVSAFSETTPSQDGDRSWLFTEIEAYCLANLADPNLSMRSIAVAHGISVRYLHKLAQHKDISLSTWIRRQRLQRIRKDLADPALVHHTPTSLAARWGILDGNHLSRALKAEFGQTPTQIRRTAGMR